MSQQELIDQIVNLSKQKGAISAADCQRSSRKLKALNPDQVRELFLIAQALGKGKVDGSGSTAKFAANA